MTNGRNSGASAAFSGHSARRAMPSMRRQKAWAILLLLGVLQMAVLPVGAQTSAPSTTEPVQTEPPVDPPTDAPTIATLAPTSEATPEPTTTAPTAGPTESPTTAAPTDSPTGLPTTLAPTLSPTPVPTVSDSAQPTETQETAAPTGAPTLSTPTPTVETAGPSAGPTGEPTPAPSTGPTFSPSVATSAPTEPGEPTSQPSSSPAPTPGPTLAASEVPSAVPSLAPVTAPPTAPPTPGPVFVQGDFTVTLKVVASGMDDSTKSVFVEEALLFLQNQLGQLEQPVNVLSLTVTDQTMGSTSRMRRSRVRRLQDTTLQALNVDMAATGDFVPMAGMAETPDDVNLGRLCSNLFRVRGTSVFLPQLAALESPHQEYFATVTTVESTFSENNAPPAPTAAPADGGGGGGDGGIPTGAIAGVAVAGALLAVLVAGFMYQHRRKRNLLMGNDGASSWGRPPDTASAAGRQSRFFGAASYDSEGNRRNKKAGASAAAQSELNEEDVMPMQRMESEDLSYLQSDMQSQLGADSTLMGQDSMSYAYSLDHGFDQKSVTSDMQSDLASDMTPIDYASTAVTPIPTEIPRITTSKSDGENQEDNIEIEDYVPSTDAGDGKITRECFAPPGKLGVVIDTTLGGPTVHTVNAGSPLEGVVWPGDMIVAIDDVDCRAMSAQAITDLMVKTADKRRKLTIVSDTDS